MREVNNAKLKDGLLFRRVIRPIVHPTVMMRREVLERLGGYRDYRYAEDHDLWLRAIDHFRVHRLNRCLLRYRIYGGGVSERRSLEQTVATCMSATNFYLHISTGVDCFQIRPDLFRALERTAVIRISSDVIPAMYAFRAGRRSIRNGSVVLGAFQLCLGLVRYGLKIIPWFTTRAQRRIVDELVRYGREYLMSDNLSVGDGCAAERQQAE